MSGGSIQGVTRDNSSLSGPWPAGSEVNFHVSGKTWQYRDNGKENGNYYMVVSIFFSSIPIQPQYIPFYDPKMYPNIVASISFPLFPCKLDIETLISF